MHEKTDKFTEKSNKLGLKTKQKEINKSNDKIKVYILLKVRKQTRRLKTDFVGLKADA